jgi:hypothetical protein
MANCNDIFRSFNGVIRLSDKDRETLKIARNSLRIRISDGFGKLSEGDRKTHSLEFQSQGSFIMDTIIKPEIDDFDLDDGVYFQGGLPEQKRSETKVFHELIYKAIDKNHDIEEIIDKPTCIRVKYYKKNGEDLGFHIDIPIYYAENLSTPELADTKKGWIISNPVEFIAWFEEKAKSGFEKAFILENRMFSEYEKWLTDIRKQDVQLRRIVRYLKAWADTKKAEMPPGIVMTILAAENFCQNESRDDISLKDTLIKIKEWLEIRRFQCPRPTTPINENLLASWKTSEMDFFKTALNNFIISAKQAVESQNPKEACLKWQKHLGSRFPCSLAKDEIEGAKQFIKPAIIGDNAKSA